MAEQGIVNAKAVGSNPTPGAMRLDAIIRFGIQHPDGSLELWNNEQDAREVFTEAEDLSDDVQLVRVTQIVEILEVN